MECQSKIKSFIVSFIPIPFIIIFIFLISQGEEYDYKFWKNLSEILIVVVIFTISSLWAVRASSFYSGAQEYNSFYDSMKNNSKLNTKTIQDKDLERIIEEPASIYLSSAKGFRSFAIIYNMMLFYLFVCLVFLFIQFLFNLKIFSFIEQFLFLDKTLHSIVIMIIIISIIVAIIAIYRKLPDEISLIFLLPFLCLILIFLLVLITGRTYSYFNILLFSIALYLTYLSYRISQLAIYEGRDPFQKFVIWTHDSMSVIPILQTKTIKPDYELYREKIKEMENLWKMSIFCNLKKIFPKIKNNGTLKRDCEKNFGYIIKLNKSLYIDEWKDPSIIYIYSLVKKLEFIIYENNPSYRYRIIDGKLFSKTPEDEEERSQNGKKAAEKRWKQKKKELKKSEKGLEKLKKRNYEDNKNDPEFINEKIEKRCKIKELKRCIKPKAKEIDDNLSKLFNKIDEISDIVGRIEKICNKILIEIEELKENKNEEKKGEVKKEINFLSELLEKIKDGIEEGLYDKIKKKIDELNNKLPDEKAYKEEIKILEELLIDINKFKSKKDEIKDICDALIEIYKNRTKN